MEILDPAIGDELFLSDRSIRTKVQDGAPAFYKEGCEVRDSIVSAGCIIEGKVERSVLSRNVEIGKGAVVKNSIIFQRVKIREGARVENVIIDKYAQVSEGSVISGGSARPVIIGKNRMV
jgi:glucose-1-phosphate adenylyltransferase